MRFQKAACSGVLKETEILVTVSILMVCELCQEDVTPLQVLEAYYMKYKIGLTPKHADIRPNANFKCIS